MNNLKDFNKKRLNCEKNYKKLSKNNYMFISKQKIKNENVLISTVLD